MRVIAGKMGTSFSSYRKGSCVRRPSTESTIVPSSHSTTKGWSSLPSCSGRPREISERYLCQLNDWMSILAKGGGAKKRFQYCLNSYSSRHISYLIAIQGHFGGIAVDPELQDNVLLPKGFTEYIFHVGNASELNSTIGNGLIPEEKSLKRGRQSVFFTTVNPIEDEKIMEETPCDFTKPRIAPYKNAWEPHQNTVY